MKIQYDFINISEIDLQCGDNMLYLAWKTDYIHILSKGQHYEL